MYKFHKVHHEYSEVFSLATEYMHPVDYIVGVLVNLYLFRFRRQYLLSFWEVERIVLPSFSGRFGRWWWALKGIADIIFLGAPPAYSSLSLILRSMTITMLKMLGTIAGASTSGTFLMDQVRITLDNTE